jgi:hypothetical protein
VVRHGTIIDATLVAAAVKAPRGPKGTVTPGNGSAHDPEAEWSTRQEGSPRCLKPGE